MKDQRESLPVLIEMLQSYAQDPGLVVNEGTSLTADLELDSVKLLDLMMEIEDRFDVSIPMNLLPDIHTVGDLATKLEELVS